MAPLAGVRIVEFAGMGPAPFAAMVLADLGAEVVRVDRADATRVSGRDVLNRGRTTVRLDLKSPEGLAGAFELIARADILLEGFRPGVMERLGLGPEECLRRNPDLVFGRVTGWGQHGPNSSFAGHDINYVSLSGSLAHIVDRSGHPVAPLNLVGDFGGGAMFLVAGVLAALVERERSGRGQQVDVAMVDGAASLMSLFWGFRGLTSTINGIDEDRPGSRMLDGGAPYYRIYRCADGKFLAVGCIESKFYRELVTRLGLDDDPDFEVSRQNDNALWPTQRAKLESLFATRSREYWCELLERTDACVTPVLTMTEAAAHPHNAQRQVFGEVGSVTQPAPPTRFSRSRLQFPDLSSSGAADLGDVLRRWAEPAADAATSAPV